MDLLQQINQWTKELEEAKKVGNMSKVEELELDLDNANDYLRDKYNDLPW